MGVQKRIRGGKTRWVARYRDPGGKERSKTFDREKDGKAWLAQQLAAMEGGTWQDPANTKVTVGQLFDNWVASEFRTANTYKTYLYTRRTMLEPLAHLPASSVTAVQVRQWYDRMRAGRDWIGGQDEGVSHSTAAASLSHLRNAFAYGVEVGIVPRNPVRSTPPRRVGVRVEIPTKAEVERVIYDVRHGGYEYPVVRNGKKTTSTARPAPIYADLMEVGKLSGMRASEVLALDDADLDFAAKVIEVTTQANRSGERVQLKTPAARRIIPMVPELEEVLARYAGSGRLFKARTGGVVSYAALSHAIAIGRQELDHVNFHSLRHHFASQLLASGLPVQDVSALLGHASPAVTLGVYAHVVEGAQDRARDAIAETLSRGTAAGRGHLRAV